MNVINSKVVNIDELKLEHFTKGDETRKIRAGDVICCPVSG